MQSRKSKRREGTSRKTAPLNELRLKPAGEAKLEYSDLPPRAPADKRIHPRRTLPNIPDRPADDSESEHSTKSNLKKS
jgi:hypothetical protein